MTASFNPVGTVLTALNTMRTELEGLLIPILNQASTASGSISENAIQNVLDTLNSHHAKVTTAAKAAGAKS